MAKTGYTTYWVPEIFADRKACLAQHQRTFKGNQLAIVGEMVKVAVLAGEMPPRNSTTKTPVPAPMGNMPV